MDFIAVSEIGNVNLAYERTTKIVDKVKQS